LKDRYPELSVAILAGGMSSRMGKDKALIKIEGERIIDRLTKELACFGDVTLSVAHKNDYSYLGLKTVVDEHKEIGPIEGIRSVLSEADSEYVFICASDMPFISKELVSYLAGYISSDYDCYVIADEDHIHPLCAIYSKKVLPVIEELIDEGSYRLREIFRKVRTKYVSLEFTTFDKNTVRNINTKEELREVSKPFVFCVSGYSDSGKTGLIVKLINEFISAGMTVGVIKHDGHDCHRDMPGSDTDRCRKAGAIAAAVLSESSFSIYSKESKREDELICRMKEMDSPPDVIILEGFKKSPHPKIEVVRKAVNPKSECDISSIICLVTDCISPESFERPIFGSEDIKGVFLCLKEYFDMEI
jgi:molybdopterin-guanine dinucleotide biosynthesis protein